MINHNLGLLIISCLVLAIILYVFFWMRWNNKRKITIREQEEERLRVLEIEKQIEADRNEKISFTNHHLKYSLKVDSNLVLPANKYAAFSANRNVSKSENSDA